jgi:deoxyribodipyrimidine photo-lyase
VTNNNLSIFWFRQDLRLHDNPALTAALDHGQQLLPVYILPDEQDEWATGEASRWWLQKSLSALAGNISKLGSRLIIRRGTPRDVLAKLVEQHGASDVFFNATYEPQALLEDAELATALRDHDTIIHSYHGNLLKTPSEVKNKSDAPYKVYTPFYRFYLQAGYDTHTVDAPAELPPVDEGIDGLPPDSLNLLPEHQWQQKLEKYWQPGEEGAMQLIKEIDAEKLANYSEARDFPAATGTTKLSPHLHFGEISPRQLVTHLDQLAATSSGNALMKGRENLVRQLIWRDFAYHILVHFPHTTDRPFQDGFDQFPWRETDEEFLSAWKQGKTGIPIVDAGMRELWETGWMHNRVRMIVASLLTKNARQHWLEGARWFWGTLVDADLANNSMGWQWVAGCGVDAAPYFRIFNPVSQSKKFDPDGEYLKRWLPELAPLPTRYIHEPWAAPADILDDANIRLGRDYPCPLIDIAETRKEALAEYNSFRKAATTN